MAAHRHGGDGLAGLEHVMPLISGIEIVPSDVVTFNGKVVRVNKRGEAVKRGGKPFRPNNLVIKLKR
jgi:hypothetical protein